MAQNICYISLRRHAIKRSFYMQQKMSNGEKDITGAYHTVKICVLSCALHLLKAVSYSLLMFKKQQQSNKLFISKFTKIFCNLV